MKPGNLHVRCEVPIPAESNLLILGDECTHTACPEPSSSQEKAPFFISSTHRKKER